MPEPLDLEKKIIKTIIYFDLFNYPLTDWEIWQWLWNDDLNQPIKVEFFAVRKTLEASDYLKEKLDFKNNLYFLKGREIIVAERREKYVYAWQKLRKVKRIARILKLIPFIKLIAVCNDLAYFNAPADSDLDLFIITKENRIWLSRFFSVFIIKLLNLRPTKENKKDKVCLSIFVSEAGLNLENLKINQEDIHFTYWLEILIPVYDAGGYYEKLRQANNWLAKNLPQAMDFEPALRIKITESKIMAQIKIFFGRLACNLDERFYRWLQYRKFSPSIKELMNKDSRVVVNDKILKFHTNDNRSEILDKFTAALKFL